MTDGARVVVLGMAGLSPVAGVAWQVLHYLEGFRRAGCDVYYLEDTGNWPYDPVRNEVTDDPSYTVGYLGRLLGGIGLADRWAYVAPDRSVHGLPDASLAELLAAADALVNVTGATELRAEHMQVPVRMYVESDPVYPQVELALGRRTMLDLVGSHTHHFSFGENLGAPDCPVPVEGFRYLPTRQPVVVDWWDEPAAPDVDGHAYTTISSWVQAGKDVEWQGEPYAWSKHSEFVKFLELPRASGRPLEIALSPGDVYLEIYDEAVAMLEEHGWRVVDALALSRELAPYRDYIRRSRGEFTVAKDQYVRLRTGWFSDRSACYLAAGRPVVTQETGFSKFLPTGEGLFGFETLEEAVAALETIEGDYARHARAARELAADHFGAEQVARSLLARTGL